MRKYAESPANIARRAAATRKRRREAGLYPTDAHNAAFNRWLAREELTVEELQTLATNPALSSSQRSHFAALAAA